MKQLRRLAVPVYLPAFLFGVGQGAAIPVVALSAKSLGASTAIAGLTVTAAWLGVLLFDLPSGWIIARFGEGAAIFAGTATLVVATGIAAAAQSPAVFGVAVVLMGAGWAVWFLARLHYVGEVVPVEIRGQAMSLYGGVTRAGVFVGPFLGAGMITIAGLRSVYVIHGVTALAAALVIFVTMRGNAAQGYDARTTTKFREVFIRHRRVYATAGVAAATVQALRAIRQAILPLWAVHIGLGAEAASLLFALSMAAEVTVFYPAGIVMDRVGRKPIAAASLGMMSLGLLLIPLSHGTAQFAIAALVVGFGNGLGSGINATLGIDFAPRTARAPFLGGWRVIADFGAAGGPLGMSAIIAVTTLGTASVASGLVGVAAAAFLLIAVPETLGRHHATHVDALDAEPIA